MFRKMFFIIILFALSLAGGCGNQNPGHDTPTAEVAGTDMASQPPTFTPTPSSSYPVQASETIPPPQASDTPLPSQERIKAAISVNLEVFHNPGNDVGLESEYISFIEESEELICSGFSLSIDFGEELSEETIRRYVSFSGPVDDHFQFLSDFPVPEALTFNLPEVRPGDEYSLLISKDLPIGGDSTLGQDIKKTVRITENDPAMSVRLQGVREFPGFDVMAMAKGVRECLDTIHLTDSPKTFELSFSRPVDRDVVQTYMIQGFSPGIEYSFDWKDSSSCVLSLSRLKSGEKVDLVYCENRGSEKFKVDTFSFLPVTPVSLYSYDLINGGKTLINTFEDLTYMPLKCGSYDRSFFLDIYRCDYIYNMELDSVQPVKSGVFGYPGVTESVQFLADGSFVSRSGADFQKVDPQSLRAETLFTLKNDVKDLFTTEIALSPDKTMLAYVLYNIGDYGGPMAYIQVSTLDGMAVYESSAPVTQDYMEMIAGKVYLDWLDDDTLVYYDNQKITALDVKTSKTDILAENCESIYSVFNGKILFRRVDSRAVKYVLYDNGKETVLFNSEDMEVPDGNFTFAGNLLFYEKHGSQDAASTIYSMDPVTGDEKVVVDGYIVGTSSDRTRLFYVNRFENFVFIP